VAGFFLVGGEVFFFIVLEFELRTLHLPHPQCLWQFLLTGQTRLL
jgi:hypothetical protein